MRGFSQVWKGSVTAYDNMAMQNHLNVQKIYPEIGGMDPRPLMEASVHTLFTDIIEVADDGRSARGSFITPGVIFCRLNRHEYPYCNVLWERYGAATSCWKRASGCTSTSRSAQTLWASWT